jgi:hypothetical protein
VSLVSGAMRRQTGSVEINFVGGQADVWRLFDDAPTSASDGRRSRASPGGRLTTTETTGASADSAAPDTTAI